MTFDQAINSFINYLKEKGRSPSTLIAYSQDLKQLFDYVAKTYKVSQIEKVGSTELEEYIEKLKKDGDFTMKTISRKINSLKTFYRFLVSNKVISENFTKKITHPTVSTKPPRVLSQMEYKALRDSSRRNLRLYTMVEVLLQTGMRIGELSRLKVENVQLTSNPKVIEIEAFESNRERKVELNDMAHQALANYMLIRKSTAIKTDYLFHTKSGKPVLVRNIRSAIDKAFKKAGIENAAVNDVRNTFIVYQLEKGMRPERLADIVGHQRVSSTEKYLEFTNHKKKRAITKIEPL